MDVLTSSHHRGEVEILCFQGEQNKQLQRNLNAPHVNFPPTVTCFCGDYSVGLLMRDPRPCQMT